MVAFRSIRIDKHYPWLKRQTKPIYSKKFFSDKYFFFFNFLPYPPKNLHLHENRVSNTQSKHQGTLGTSYWVEYKGNVHLKLPPFYFIIISLDSRRVNSALVRPRLESRIVFCGLSHWLLCYWNKKLTALFIVQLF
jgi:hypothetical protein